MDYLIIAGKSIAVYLFIVVAIRLFGKKELAQLSVVDLVFILLISNAVQNAMVGQDSSLLGGFAAASALFVVNYIFKMLLYRFPKLSGLIQGKAIMLVYQGNVLEDNMQSAQMTMAELDEAVREHGVEHTRSVDLAILEIDGNISIISNDFQKKSFRKRKSHRMISKNY